MLEDYLKAVEDLQARVAKLTASMVELVEFWDRGSLVKALQAMRGVSTIVATTVVAELGDLRRFESAPKLMGYLGLVPSEHSSGDSKQRGRITRTGNGHVRRVLIEAAWSYRHRKAVSEELRRRARGISPEVQAIAWRAQERLCPRYRKLLARGMNKNKVVTAIARELAGFIWSIGQQPRLLTA